MGQVALVLSPHLDDAVLSCPGYMQRLWKAGVKVVIATVFTASDVQHSALYHARRLEDEQAARILRVSAEHLGFLDAPFRSARYDGFCGIIFGKAREYARTLVGVSSKLRDMIRSLAPGQVLAPLAVGNHVDHRLVREAALSTVDRHLLLFYEERPYAFVPGQVRQVLGSGEPLDTAYFEAAYVRRYSGRTRRATIAAKWSWVQPVSLALRRDRMIRLDAAELERALRAIRAYRTQLADLFANEDEMRSQYAAIPETLWKAERVRSPQPSDVASRDGAGGQKGVVN